ncbi:MAG: DNA-formamidopyrimidine glycosylase family protein, partial [Gemmatimonadaceae bacterium]
MPELPEVERAARLVGRAARGRRIERVRVLHPSLARHLPPRAARALAGRRIEQVQRRGKHQLFRLDDGSALHVHFRMTGDWAMGRTGEPDEPYTRLALELDDATRIALVDPRALSAVALLDDADGALSSLGVEPLD